MSSRRMRAHRSGRSFERWSLSPCFVSVSRQQTGHRYRSPRSASESPWTCLWRIRIARSSPESSRPHVGHRLSSVNRPSVCWLTSHIRLRAVTPRGGLRPRRSPARSLPSGLASPPPPGRPVPGTALGRTRGTCRTSRSSFRLSVELNRGSRPLAVYNVVVLSAAEGEVGQPVEPASAAWHHAVHVGVRLGIRGTAVDTAASIPPVDGFPRFALHVCSCRRDR